MNGFRSSFSTSLSESEYHRLSNHALEYLTESLDTVIAEHDKDGSFDLNYAMGVLTLKLGRHGTYVLNKQPPNLQIWLSSPLSGPKRYDWINGRWLYKRDGSRMDDLLSTELSAKLKTPIKLEIPPVNDK